MSKNLSTLVDGELVQVPKGAVWKNIIEKQSKWFNINHEKAYNALKFVFKNNFDMKRSAEKLRNKNIENFSMKIMTEKFNKIIENVKGLQVC